MKLVRYQCHCLRHLKKKPAGSDQRTPNAVCGDVIHCPNCGLSEVDGSKQFQFQLLKVELDYEECGCSFHGGNWKP